ncbi:auxin-binding protein ABP19a-like [Argentina anserina]|uniref:auxin-binding protein ABP19a-like n=1 Tax=Argentina anserina TaxID=57926 RepID=UPI0021768D2D|nr:auxin-binding protein ABP19a-like [Potentilla anserina]
MMISRFFFLFSLIITSSYAAMQDFCVADYAAPQSPAGYACKDPTKVTVDDFVFSGLRVAGNISSINKVRFSSAFAVNFPGLNGLGVSLVRSDFSVGGVVSIHSHRDATELVILIEGTVLAGFIASNNKPYVKSLNKGDTMVFPQGLFHFLVNVGNTPALAYASFSSANPGVQFLETALFQNNLPTEIIAKSTLLDTVQIQKLKRLLGGTN